MQLTNDVHENSKYYDHTFHSQDKVIVQSVLYRLTVTYYEELFNENKIYSLLALFISIISLLMQNELCPSDSQIVYITMASV